MFNQGYTDPQGRRQHQRHPVNYAAEVYFDPARKISVGLIDLSFEGLRIKAEYSAFKRMLPAISIDDDYDRIPLRVSFSLNNETGHQTNIKILAGSAYFEHSATDCQMGLEIIDVEEGVLEFADFINGLNE